MSWFVRPPLLHETALFCSRHVPVTCALDSRYVKPWMYKLRAVLVTPFAEVYVPVADAHDPTFDQVPALYSASCVAPSPDMPERKTNCRRLSGVTTNWGYVIVLEKRCVKNKHERRNKRVRKTSPH